MCISVIFMLWSLGVSSFFWSILFYRVGRHLGPLVAIEFLGKEGSYDTD